MLRGTQSAQAVNCNIERNDSQSGSKLTEEGSHVWPRKVSTSESQDSGFWCMEFVNVV